MPGHDMHPLTRIFHLTGDFTDALAVWHRFLAVIANTQGVTVLGTQHELFPCEGLAANGLTGLVMLAESHAALHTWPEENYAQVTFSTCSGRPSLVSFIEQLADAWCFQMEWQEAGTGAVSSVLLCDDRIICGSTGLQDYDFLYSPDYGRVMAVDGILQVTELDSHIYHEALCWLPLLYASNQQDVLVIGGGDGFAVRTLLAYPGRRNVRVVEIDRELAELALRFFGNAALLEHPGVNWVWADAADWLAGHTETYDVILLDTTDPVNAQTGNRLQESTFWQDLRSSLRPGGLVAAQAGSEWFRSAELRNTLALAQAHFPVVCPYLACDATGRGPYGFVLAGNEPLPAPRPVPGQARYLTDDLVKTLFTLPPQLRQTLSGEGAA